jgi:hypothetical protein
VHKLELQKISLGFKLNKGRKRQKNSIMSTLSLPLKDNAFEDRVIALPKTLGGRIPAEGKIILMRIKKSPYS